MTREEFVAILSDDDIVDSKVLDDSVDNALDGLNLIMKYVKNMVVMGAGNEIIYSVSVDTIIEKGITKEDAVKLRQLYWLLQGDKGDEFLACFV